MAFTLEEKATIAAALFEATIAAEAAAIGLEVVSNDPELAAHKGKLQTIGEFQAQARNAVQALSAALEPHLSAIAVVPGGNDNQPEGEQADAGDVSPDKGGDQ